MNNYLVTGGAGFIGAHLVKNLVEDGNNVIVIDNLTRGSASRLTSVINEINFVNLDLTKDRNKLIEITKNIDYFYHLAAVNGTDNFYNHPDLVLDVGVKSILNCLNACETNSIKKLIVASSAEVYQTPKIIPTDESAELIIPDPLEPRYSYGASKIISEQLTLAYLNKDRINGATIFRPHNVYGEDMGFKHVVPQFFLKANKCKMNDYQTKFEIIGQGNETRAFCYVSDIVDGLRIIEKGDTNNEIYHIGNDHEVSINDVFNIINNFYEDKLCAKYIDGHGGGTPRRCPDISKISKLGYVPKIQLNEGLERTYNFYKDLSFSDATNKLI